MKSFFYNNQTIVSVVGVILFLVILYFIIRALPTKVAKKQQKEEKKQEAEIKKDSDKVEVDESLAEEKLEKKEKKDKKEEKKPKIVQVYKRESRESSGSSKNKKSYDPIYDRSVEFVNTSKNIAKFKSFVEEKKEEPVVDDFGFVEDIQEDCEFCETKTKHFDHSRRLSKAIKEDDFENMFDSHISEKYMNIKMERHLNVNEDFENKLFSRTENMIRNSKAKCKCEESGDSETQRFSLFSDFGQNESVEEDIEEDVKIDMKTALLAEVYFGKRKKR